MKHPYLNHSKTKLTCFCKSILHFLGIFVFQVSPFWIELTYFVIFSVLGFVAFKLSTPKTASFVPKDIDLFFMSVSSVTVSSLSTVEMEVFSNAQLILMTLLMLAGGEVFSSLLGLQLMKFKKRSTHNPKILAHDQNDHHHDQMDRIELGVVSSDDHDDDHIKQESQQKSLEAEDHQDLTMMNIYTSSFDVLSSVILCYLLVIHFLGSGLIFIYYKLIPSARRVLAKKGLNLITFSIFTTVSTFANCGFIPTNENMMIFKKNSGLQLILIPQLLMGNTLYPVCLRVFVWFLHKITRREELEYLLKNPKALGYDHLFSDLHSKFLAVTAAGFVVAQLVAFVALEWRSEATADLSAYEKVVGSLFEVVNSRHAGESVFDLSLITPAMIVLFVLMMYLPPYTCFLPIKDGKEICTTAQKKNIETAGSRRTKNIFSEYLSFSQLTYLVVFTILICITERAKMEEDPLNFSLLNIIVEIISGYGNVGFSMGYSCKRRIKVGGNSNCKGASYGFVGKWSPQGKFILIIVMFFGRLKKFNMKNHKAWRLQ